METITTNHNRFNTFYLVHKALRALMFDTALSIQQTDFTDKDEAVSTSEKIRQTVINFDDHADHEDTFLMPMILKINAEVVNEFEKEHVTDRRIGKAITDALSELKLKLKLDESDDNRKATGLKLLYLFNEFIGFNLYHMNKEEDILNKILWENYTDAEILEMEGRLIRSISPEKNMFTVSWMMKSASNNEITEFLNFQNKEMPGEVYNMLISLTEKAITPDRWQRIQPKIQI